MSDTYFTSTVNSCLYEECLPPDVSLWNREIVSRSRISAQTMRIMVAHMQTTQGVTVNTPEGFWLSQKPDDQRIWLVSLL
jgi:hypothetical protein